MTSSMTVIVIKLKSEHDKYAHPLTHLQSGEQKEYLVDFY